MGSTRGKVLMIIGDYSSSDEDKLLKSIICYKKYLLLPLYNAFDIAKENHLLFAKQICMIKLAYCPPVISIVYAINELKMSDFS